MPGVRVHHPTHRNGRYTVETPTQYGVPYACPICHRVHIFKAHHIDLDDGGNGIVSEGVLADLRRVGLAGLEIVNEVKEPPRIYVAGLTANGAPIIQGERPINPEPVGALILKEG